jgi:transposase
MPTVPLSKPASRRFRNILVDFTRVKNIFLCTGKTDLRRGVDGLAAIVTTQYELDLFDDAVFLFCGGRKDRFKALYFDGDGFILLYKRFESGRLQWPKDENEVKKLSSQQVRWLLEGLSVEQAKAFKPAIPGVLA